MQVTVTQVIEQSDEEEKQNNEKEKVTAHIEINCNENYKPP